eukprot:CAMPEP_0119007018 /NCGR_PEP_ID=MMETSP1176-20130426/2713_1 /TAXON_ID=265551 /ORGANISM="Synedropsis recta cf, Strain CCMP1620" /LENGTH=629 /DNA_ID=CAMNT_0006959073 /DNA_START=46 /DNA_END=1935 /DNA_ORIENTATION=-
MNDDDGNENNEPTQLRDMVIGSMDTLTGIEINLATPGTWNDQPPLLSGFDRRGKVVPETEILLKGMLRHGVPPALRCAVQLSNVIGAVHPHQQEEDADYAHEYRTLAKVRALDGAYDGLLQRVLINSQGGSNKAEGDAKDATTSSSLYQNPTSDKFNDLWNSMEASTYGRPVEATSMTQLIPGVTDAGALAWKRVLIALEQMLGVCDHAPLIPVLSALLLCTMSESYAFCAVREMGHAVTWYFPVSRTEHAAWCGAMTTVMRKLHPATAEYLEDRGILDCVDGLAPIIRDFFVNLLPLKYVLRIMDLYTLEGFKVMFRFGVTLLVMYKKEIFEQLITISNADEWWHTLKLWASSRRFDFELLVRKSYGLQGTGIRKQLRFPGRSLLQRLIRMEEERIRTNALLDDDGTYQEPPARPLGIEHHPPIGTEEEVKPVLVQSMQVRQHIAQWLPLTLRLTNLDLIYSTNYHGRTLERFYTHVKAAKHTVLLCEVLQDDKDAPPCIVGMYASQAWRVSTKIYGDGGCFLFRLEPDASCWKWQPSGEELDFESDAKNNKTALLEQFMVGRRHYISMGGNPDGSSGLRLNEDLTVGESSTAVGFENEALHGKGRGSVFQVGMVEVYGLKSCLTNRE